MQENKNRLAAFFDIDGTLINIVHGQTKITPRVRAAIRRLRAAGGVTFIASGRPTGYLDPELLNDIEMMQTVGHALVMANARPQVKEVAEQIVPSVDDDGVAWGIEHILLQS